MHRPSSSARNVGKIANRLKLVSRELPLSHRLCLIDRMGGTISAGSRTAHLCHVHNCLQAGEEGGIEEGLSGALQHTLHGLGRERTRWRWKDT